MTPKARFSPTLIFTYTFKKDYTISEVYHLFFSNKFIYMGEEFKGFDHFFYDHINFLDIEISEWNPEIKYFSEKELE